MQFPLLLATLLPLLAAASPIKPRAGGPAFIPIASNCSVINPLPHAYTNSSNCGSPSSINGYAPSSNFTSTHQVYSFYLPPTDYAVNATNQWTGCLEQCNGFSGCKSALMAYNVPTPKGFFGTDGGVLETACFFYDEWLSPNDFVAAPQGQYVNETAGNIYCPTA